MSRSALMVSFLAAIGIVTWHEIKTLQRIPHPATYVHAAVVWAILGIVSDLGAPELAAVFGAGLVLSMVYRFYTTGTPSLPLSGAGQSSDHDVPGTVIPAR